ncbi:MAG: hypothetical protein KGQ95_06650 [Acidobacteria bacterium]|nr:hypothetical protein [Acidobacteriota bacterium]
MLNGRLYRLSWLVAALALLVALLTLESPGGTPDPPLPPAFDAMAARGIAADLATVAPERVPGTVGDAASAKWMADQLAAIPGASPVARQRFSVAAPSGRVVTENVYVSLPARGGQAAPGALVISAPRDTPPGVRGGESGSAVLVQLARALGTVARNRPVFIVSTGASTLGNAGARWFVSRFSGTPLTAAVSLDDPAGVPDGLHIWDDGQDARRSIPMAAAAEQAATRADAPLAPVPGPFAQIAAMGLPQTSGDQAAYIALGLPSVSLASRPESPLVGGNLATEDALGDAGRTAEGLISSLDRADALPAPAAGLVINSRELRPIMSRVVILLLALPLLVAALDLAVRLRRAGVRLLPFVAALLWRLLPVVVAVLVAHLLAIAGMLPTPAGGWPPLAEAVPFDLPAVVAILLSVGAGVLTWMIVRHRAMRRDAEVASRAATGVIALGVVTVLLWLVSPFALLIALPAAHCALIVTRATRPWQVIALAAVAVTPVVLLVWWASSRIDRGIPYSSWYLMETTVAGGRGVIGPMLAAAVLVIVWSLGSLVMSRVRRGLVAAGPYRPVPTEDERLARRGRRPLPSLTRRGRERRAAREGAVDRSRS